MGSRAAAGRLKAMDAAFGTSSYRVTPVGPIGSTGVRVTRGASTYSMRGAGSVTGGVTVIGGRGGSDPVARLASAKAKSLMDTVNRINFHNPARIAQQKTSGAALKVSSKMVAGRAKQMAMTTIRRYPATSYAVALGGAYVGGHIIGTLAGKAIVRAVDRHNAKNWARSRNVAAGRAPNLTPAQRASIARRRPRDSKGRFK